MFSDHLLQVRDDNQTAKVRRRRWPIIRLFAVAVLLATVLLPTPAASAAPGDWIQVGSDIDGEAVFDESGHSVAFSADGNTVAIGAVINGGSGANAGHVRVYSFDGTSWTQAGTDIDGEAAQDLSGWSVALSSDGNTVAIGAQLNDGSGGAAGHVRVYGFDGTDWIQNGDDIDGETSGDMSGYSVALSGDGNTVLIGAIGNDDSAINAGHARVFGFDGTNWTQTGGDIDGESASDWSAWFVDISDDGTTIAVGAYLNDGSGAAAGHVRVFGFDGTNWTQTGSDIDGEFADDRSGYSVALSADGNTVAIGAIFNDGTATRAGHVRVFGFDGTNWTQTGSDIDGEAAEDRSGWSVALSADGTTVAIGAIGNDETGLDAGHVRVYDFDGTSWSQTGDDIDGEAADDQSGWSVALSADGTTVAVGAVTNDGGGEDAGHVRIYAAEGVSNQPPVADAGGPYLVSVGQTITFDGSGSSDPDGDPLTETWTADGGTVIGNVYTAGLAPGAFNVCLTVNDGTVDSEPACTIVIIDQLNEGFVTGGGKIDSPRALTFLTRPLPAPPTSVSSPNIGRTKPSQPATPSSASTRAASTSIRAATTG